MSRVFKFGGASIEDVNNIRKIGNLIKELSPQGEPGIRKYFVNPPSESWEPKTGSYSFNLTWTYELDK